jgi:hypothetical protein
MNANQTITPADRFQICVAALLLASDAGREDLIPALKAAAAAAARAMNGQGIKRQRAARAAARGSIRRVVSPDGRYV